VCAGHAGGLFAFHGRSAGAWWGVSFDRHVPAHGARKKLGNSQKREAFLFEWYYQSNSFRKPRMLDLPRPILTLTFNNSLSTELGNAH
jgi:hypothetical protein